MDVTVIIPVFNVEAYLDDCLKSVVAGVGKLDAEFLLVDDASEDSSGSIAEAWAARDSRFRCWHVPHGGLSRARNFAVPRASGKYIQFVDSDDLLESLSTQDMFALAEANRSDLTVCHVARLQGSRTLPSSLHVRAFSPVREAVTHISRSPSLVYDSTSWNKLIRRDFYLENGFSFPEGFTYEDMPVMTAMHCAANHVSVWGRTGYLWRVRGESITQTPTVENMGQKLSMMERVLEEIRAHSFPESVRDAELVKFLNYDMGGFLRLLGALEPSQTEELFGRLVRFVKDNYTTEVLSQCPVSSRQIAAALRERDLPRLLRLHNHVRWGYPKAPVSRQGQEWRLALPRDLYTVPDRDARADFASQLPRQRITGVRWEEDRLWISGFVFFPRLSVAAGEQTVDACIRNLRSGKEMALEAQPADAPEVTEEFGTVPCFDDWTVRSYSYDGAGYRICIDAAPLRGNPDYEGENLVYLRYGNAAVSGWVELGSIAPALRKLLPGTARSEADFSCRLLADKRGALVVAVGSAPLPPPPVRHSEAEYRKVERLWKAGKKQIGALTQEQERLLERVRGLEKRAAELEEKVGEGMAAARKAAEAEQANAALRAELDALRRAGFGERLRECLSALRRRAGDGRGNAKR